MNILYYLMKLLFGFCSDFLLPKNLDNTGENLEITKKSMATMCISLLKDSLIAGELISHVKGACVQYIIVVKIGSG